MDKFFGEISDENLFSYLLCIVLSQLAPGEKMEDILKKLTGLPNEGKFQILREYVEKYSKYRADFIVDVVSGMVNRLKIAYNYQYTEKLRSPILLIRPKEMLLTGLAEDYDLSKVTSGKVEVKFVDGNHSTMLGNLELVEMINNYV